MFINFDKVVIRNVFIIKISVDSLLMTFITAFITGILFLMSVIMLYEVIFNDTLILIVIAQIFYVIKALNLMFAKLIFGVRFGLFIIINHFIFVTTHELFIVMIKQSIEKVIVLLVFSKLSFLNH